MGYNIAQPMKPNFVVWDSRAVKDGCVLQELVGVDKVYNLRKGVPMGDTFPDKAGFTMDPDFPNNTLLTDHLLNTSMMIVASPRLKGFLEGRAIPAVEYLKVTILNHKGKAASRDYCIVHPIDPVDCLDVEKCEPTWALVDKTTINRVKKLVIDESKVAKNRMIFRPKSFYRAILVRRDLAEAIDKEDFTGIGWIEMEKFKG